MKKTLVCGNCGELIAPHLSRCPRCGASIEFAGEAEPQSNGEAEPQSNEQPSFHSIIEEPFERMEYIVKRRHGERLDKIEEKLIRLEEELDSFLSEKQVEK